MTAKSDSRQATYMIRCVGRSPLLMDRFPPDVMVKALVHGERLPKDTESLLEERCLPKIYRNAEGAPILQAEHLTACLRGAGRSIKIGKEGKISTADSTKLFSFLDLDGLEFPLIFSDGINAKSLLPSKGGEAKNDPTSPWCVDVRRGVGEATGIANALVRPKFEKWGFEVLATVDYTALEGLTEAHVRDLFKHAGNRVGLLSYRPQCNGSFGRFLVESFEAV